MASAPEVASFQDVVSVPDVASLTNGAPVLNGNSMTDAPSVPNGSSTPTDSSHSNGTSVTNGITNGATVLNGTSSASPISNGISAVASVPDDPCTLPVPEGISTGSSTPVSIRLAIVGGGIGGIALALGLLKHPHIDFQIYEAAPIWVQIGAGLGLGPNAQSALELLGPEAESAFRKNVTGNLWESHKKTFLNFYSVSSILPPGISILSGRYGKQLITSGYRDTAPPPASIFTCRSALQDCSPVTVHISSMTSSHLYPRIAYI